MRDPWKISGTYAAKSSKLDANLNFEAQLASTETQVGNELTPLKGKGYLVVHDAYGYFEKQFGLTPLGHFTVNPQDSTWRAAFMKIKTQLVGEKQPAFFWPRLRPAVVESVARGTCRRTGNVNCRRRVTTR
ncbi:metal ABC transporter solute-binding protein, Zn/Mn family [Shigella flexneri]